MKHRKTGVKLGRTTSHRTAMFRNMVTSLLKYDRIQTTDVKAKELRRWADNIITLAKRGDLHARRQALAIVMEKDVVNKLFAEAAERFGSRAGGYTRIVKLGRRPGDAAPVSIIELISAETTKTKDKKPKKKKGDKAAKPKTRKSKDVSPEKEETASAAQDMKPDVATAEKPEKKKKTKAVSAKDTVKKVKAKKEKTSKASKKADDSPKKD
ncbi:MAG: 50S ribosomal protein L17 [Desulfobacterales bacterium]|nr:50S ribosomal protein L17 [Desulfobacterales bacterium]